MKANLHAGSDMFRIQHGFANRSPTWSSIAGGGGLVKSGGVGGWISKAKVARGRGLV